jgi:hypothetical protein
VLLVSVFIAVALAPFDMTFYWWTPPAVYDVFGKVLDVIFIADTILHFNTAVIHNGVLVMDRKEIALHYLKTYFFVDLASNTPWDWFIVSDNIKEKKLSKLAKFPKILKLVLLWRVLQKETQYVGATHTVCALILVAHYYTCFWSWALLYDYCSEEGATCPGVGETYVEGMSISMASIGGSDAWRRLMDQHGISRLAVSREPGQPLMPMEELVTAMMQVLGFVLVGCLFANLASALTRTNQVARTRFAMLESRRAEMKLNNIHKDLQGKVEATYEHIWKYGSDLDGMLHDPCLSLDLRRNLALCVYGPAMRKVPIFMKMADMVMKKLCQRLECRLYTPGDLLVMVGEVGSELFIIQSGCVQPLNAQGETIRGAVLGEGAFFGEICFLRPGSRRTASIRCLLFCRTLVLTLDVFQELHLEEHLVHLREEAASMQKVYERASRSSQDGGRDGSKDGAGGSIASQEALEETGVSGVLDPQWSDLNETNAQDTQDNPTTLVRPMRASTGSMASSAAANLQEVMSKHAHARRLSWIDATLYTEGQEEPSTPTFFNGVHPETSTSGPGNPQNDAVLEAINKLVHKVDAVESKLDKLSQDQLQLTNNFKCMEEALNCGRL